MKPPEQLSDKELRIEIAEWCGYKGILTTNLSWLDVKGYIPTIDGSSSREVKIPDYPNDLNAMWEAEEILDKKCIWEVYEHNLQDEVKKSGYGLGFGKGYTSHTTAKQRAIAFVKTIREIKGK